MILPVRATLPRIKLKDQVAERLIEVIASGRLAGGTRLPSERELVGRLGVSRTVVREALNLLEARGVLQVEHGRGAIVRTDPSHVVRDALLTLLRVIEPIGELLRASRQVSASRPGSARRALREHEAILRAVAAGNAPRAREAMRTHLQATERDLLAVMGRSLSMRPHQHGAAQRGRPARRRGSAAGPRRLS